MTGIQFNKKDNYQKFIQAIGKKLPKKITNIR